MVRLLVFSIIWSFGAVLPPGTCTCIHVYTQVASVTLSFLHVHAHVHVHIDTYIHVPEQTPLKGYMYRPDVRCLCVCQYSLCILCTCTITHTHTHTHTHTGTERQSFSQLLKSLTNSLPDDDTHYSVFDYYVDESGEWDVWQTRLPAPTRDTTSAPVDLLGRVYVDTTDTVS